MQENANQDGVSGEMATVLCVDDEANILTSLRRLLRGDYNIMLAHSGAEGLEILESSSVDVVISDMRMPEMDGAEFLAIVAQRWPQTMRLLLTGYADMSSTIEAINKGNIYRYISKPWDDNDLKMNVRYAVEQKQLREERDRLRLLTEQQNLELKDLNANLEDKVRQRTGELRKTMKLLETAHESLKSHYIATIKVFSGIIEMREGKLQGHARRVAANAHRLAKQMGMNEEESQQVLFAALLHDIGKISLSDELLNKPFNSLTQEESEAVCKHPALGEGLLMSLKPLQRAARYISAHHERHDGLGFPAGLKGDEIPLGAAILAVVNEYDSLQTGAIAAAIFSEAEARAYLAEYKGRRYRSDVVNEFFKLLDAMQVESPQHGTSLISSRELKEGMVLARGLDSGEGVLLLSEGSLVDEQLIESIIRFEKSMGKKFDIYVRQERKQ